MPHVLIKAQTEGRETAVFYLYMENGNKRPAWKNLPVVRMFSG